MEAETDIDLRPQGRATLFIEAIRDFLETLMHAWTWGRLAVADIEFRYRRTILGPFWIMGGTLALALSLGVVYSGVFNQKIDTYLPYLTIGVVYWSFLAGTVTEGCAAFVSMNSLIKSTAVDLSTHMLRHVLRSFILLLHNFVAIVLVWLWFRWSVSTQIFLVVPALFVGLLFTTGLSFCLAMICTRYRDVQQIVIALMQLIFFITPIFWAANALRPGHGILLYNPFYYMLEIVRAPLLDQPVVSGAWPIAVTTGVVTFAIGVSVYAAFRHRLTYWL